MLILETWNMLRFVPDGSVVYSLTHSIIVWSNSLLWSSWFQVKPEFLKVLNKDVYLCLCRINLACIVPVLKTLFNIILILLLNFLHSIISVQIFLRDVHMEPSKDNTDVIKELASNLETMKLYEYAVKFYLMIENVAMKNDVSNWFTSFHLSLICVWKGWFLACNLGRKIFVFQLKYHTFLY